MLILDLGSWILAAFRFSTGVVLHGSYYTPFVCMGSKGWIDGWARWDTVECVVAGTIDCYVYAF